MRTVLPRCVLAAALTCLAPCAIAGDHVFDSGFDDAAEGPHSDAAAARFLTQATFGPSLAEIAVVAERMDRITPCGGCRQRLAEFARPETKLYLCDQSGVVETVTMGDMLPYGFAGEMLK